MTQDQAPAGRPTRRVLMMCAGNICRSPVAGRRSPVAGRRSPVAGRRGRGPRPRRRASLGGPGIRSRGTRNWNVGRHAHPAMTRIAAGRGPDLSGHVAAQVTADGLAWAHDVLVMDADNQWQLLGTTYPEAGRVRTPAGRWRHRGFLAGGR